MQDEENAGGDSRWGGLAYGRLRERLGTGTGTSWKSPFQWISRAINRSFSVQTLAISPVVVSSVLNGTGTSNHHFDVFKYVNPLIGTINDGRCLYRRLNHF